MTLGIDNIRAQEAVLDLRRAVQQINVALQKINVHTHPESDIVPDANILCRVAGNEDISGTWQFQNAVTFKANPGIVLDAFDEYTPGAGVMCYGIFKVDTMQARVINEYGTDVGVTVDGVLLKDSDIWLGAANSVRSAGGNNHIHFSDTNNWLYLYAQKYIVFGVDDFTHPGAEFSFAGGVAGDLMRIGTAAGGLVTMYVPLSVDTINERTADAGVTTEGVLLKDGLVDGVDVADHDTRHEDGGADEIDVGGLSGQLADKQVPIAHAHAGWNFLLALVGIGA